MIRTTSQHPNSPASAVRAYKQLKMAERAFRHDQGHARDPTDPPPPRNRVRAHAFLCMLAYYVPFELRHGSPRCCSTTTPRPPPPTPSPRPTLTQRRRQGRQRPHRPRPPGPHPRRPARRPRHAHPQPSPDPRHRPQLPPAHRAHTAANTRPQAAPRHAHVVRTDRPQTTPNRGRPGKPDRHKRKAPARAGGCRSACPGPSRCPSPVPVCCVGEPE